MSAADQHIRDQALDIHRSFAVSAPAGSGKTGLLIRRTLRLLAQCEHPEQLLAITFTRKAAAEMHERIVTALQRAQDDTPPERDYDQAIWEDARAVLARDQAQGWQLVASPSRLRIMTIDSLCRHLARQLAMETGLGDLPEPADQPQTYYQEAIRNLLAQLDQPGPVADSLALLLAHLDNNPGSLAGLLDNLLAQREQWLQPLLGSRGARAVLEQALAETVEECLTDLQRQLSPVASEIAMLCDYAAANLHHLAIDHPLSRCLGMVALPGTTPDSATLNRWQAIAELVLTKDTNWRSARGLNKTMGFASKKEAVQPDLADSRKAQLAALIEWCREQPGLLELFSDLRHLPAPNYSDGQWHLLEALATMLPRLVAELSLLFREQRACDFTEITLAALRALGDDEAPTELSLRLDYQIRHILVDEVQDTSSLQFSLLRKLIGGWQPGDGRTLFIVGDGMQSLYGFRNANVGLFLEARLAPVAQVELVPLDLQVNFRSDRTIVQWVNESFQHVFPQREDISRGAVSYAPAEAARGVDASAAVTLDVIEQPADPDTEAELVVARVKAAQALDPGGSIAILTRARSHLEHILAALYEAGIPWQATDIDPLSSRMPVIDLLSLTRALLTPADRIAWLAVLRAPWCGLDLSDLERLANPEGALISRATDFPWLPGRVLDPTAPLELSTAGRQALSRTGAVLRAAWENRQRKPLRLWIEGTWLALGGPATLVNSAEIAWCQQYFDLLEAHAKGSSIADMAAFESAVERLYAAPETVHANPVQVMTIHKSKGLEFDTVIIPGLHRSGGRTDSALLYWRERLNQLGQSRLLIAPPLSPQEQAAEDGSVSLLVRHLKHEQKLKTRLEDARVLYVGCTRAVRRLHLLFNLPNKKPAAGSLLASLWPALEGDFAATGAHVERHPPQLVATQDNHKQTEPEALDELLRLTPAWRNPVQEPAQHSLDPNVPTPWTAALPGDATGRHLGTVLHRTLSRIVEDGAAHWQPQRIYRQRAAWQLQLAYLGTEPSAALVDLLETAVSRVLADPVGHWLLDSSHQASACELALGHHDDQGLVARSVIDRCFIDNGVLWIIDYKSTQPAHEQPLETFLTAETARYRDQLTRYRRAMAGLHAGEIRTALYFPLLPKLVVIAID